MSCLVFSRWQRDNRARDDDARLSRGRVRPDERDPHRPAGGDVRRYEAAQSPVTRLIGSWNVETRGFSDADRVLLGTDASIGRLTSTYWKLLNGSASAYAASGAPSRDARRGRTRQPQSRRSVRQLGDHAGDARADSRRRAIRLVDGPVRAGHPGGSAGDDRHAHGVEPQDRRQREAHRIGSTGAQRVLSFSRSFKAPTMDQLFDQRSIPVPFPPYSVTTSNALLVPQTGSGVEAGLQHRLELLAGRVVTGWSLSAYQMDMRHELDFDIATLRYVNVAESRHRGIEAAANLVAPGSTTAAVTYALQNAVATNGDNAGRFLRAIPRHTLTARVSHDPVRALSLSVAAVRVRDAPFDNANSRDLPPYTRVDARASYAVGVVRLVGEVRMRSTRATTRPDSPTRAGQPRASTIRPLAGVSIGAEARW